MHVHLRLLGTYAVCDNQVRRDIISRLITGFVDGVDLRERQLAIWNKWLPFRA